MNTHIRSVEDDADKQGEHFVENYLLYMLAAASAALSAEFHAHVRQQGLRVPEWRVLACLSDTDGQMVTQLAAFALLEQSRLTKIVDQMAIKGLVTRCSDERDRRRVRVFLTQAGRAVANDLIEAAKTHQESILAQLSQEEAETLKRVLHRIIALHGEEER